MNTLKMTMFAVSIAGLMSGCVSVNSYEGTPGAGNARECLDAQRQPRDFKVVSDREVLVKYSSYESYRVTLRDECPKLHDVNQIGFANGMDRYVGYRQGRGPIYASPIDGSGRVCGSAGDRIVLRDRLSDFTRPSEGCSIQSVERIR